MELLALTPSLLPESETLEFQCKSAIVDGELVVQYVRARDKILIDLSLTAKMGKGMLGRAEAKASSLWQQSGEWIPQTFSLESSLWGMTKKTSFDLKEGDLDPLAVAFAIRSNPLQNVGETRTFRTRDENKERMIELYSSEKKRESTTILGERDVLKVIFSESSANRNSEKVRQDYWGFWVEAETNILVGIDIGHSKLGNISFSLTSRREN